MKLASHMMSQLTILCVVFISSVGIGIWANQDAGSSIIATDFTSRQESYIASGWQGKRLKASLFDDKSRTVDNRYQAIWSLKNLPESHILQVDTNEDGLSARLGINLYSLFVSFVTIVNISLILVTPFIAYRVVKRHQQQTTSSSALAEIQDNIRFKWGLYLAIILTPVSLVMLLLWIFQGAVITDVMPQWNDGAYYWHQAASFAESGFESGYYVNEETPASAEFSSFYAWGAGIPIFYGTGFRVIGSSLAAIPMINLACLTIALACFVMIVRPSIQQALWIWALLAIFPFIYIPSTTSMIPLLQQSIAVVAAAFFLPLLSKGQAAPLWSKVGLGICLAFGVIVRPYWGLLFLPYLLLLFPKYPLPAIIASGLLFLGGIMLQGWWSTYHPNFVSTTVTEMIRAGEPASAIHRLWTVFSGNITNFIVLNNVNLITLVYRSVFLFIIAASMSILFLQQKQQRRIDWASTSTRVSFFGIYVLLGMFALMNVITQLDAYVISKELRYMTPFILMSLLIWLMSPLRRYVIYTFIPLVIAVPLTLYQFNMLAAKATNPDTRQQYAVMYDAFQQTIQVDSDASSRWCNTLLVQLKPYVFDVPFLISINAGLGISWDPDTRFLETETFRSRYLALTDELFQDMPARDQLEPIMDLPQGKLYLNLDSDCADE